MLDGPAWSLSLPRLADAIETFAPDDWFNNPEQNKFLPYLYDGVGNAEQGQIASTRMALETPVGLYIGEHSHWRRCQWQECALTRRPRDRFAGCARHLPRRPVAAPADCGGAHRAVAISHAQSESPALL